MIPEALPAAFGLHVVGPPERFGDGHIHRTVRVPVAGGDVVAQRVNTSVFPDLAPCEANLDRIDRHLAGAGLVPLLVRTRDGAVHWRDADGAPWRVTRFAHGTVGATVAADAAAAADAARLFGRYVAALADLPGGPLADTLPRFHDLPRRAGQLEAAVRADPCGRLAGCRAEVARARRLAGEVASRLTALGPLPSRNVHNDAKVANVRLDAGTGAAVVVVDLDTTMTGTVLADAGELLRTASTVAREDAPDASAVRVDPERVAAVLEGFSAGCRSVLEPRERAALVEGGPFLAVENGLRFLADHLEGDRYYGARRPGHNLDRARVQLRVTEGLLALG